MKLLISAFFTAAILAGSAPAIAQKTSTLPVEQAEGFEESNRLNKAIVDRNNQAAAQEAAAQAAWRAQQAAADQAYRDSMAKHEALVRANDEAAARERAAAEERTRAYNAEVAALAAANAEKDRQFQAQLAAAKAVNEAYERELADYNACIAGQKARCKH